MAVVEITVQPTGTETHFQTTVRLDGRRWRFDFYTNDADGSWAFDLQNDDETLQIRGETLSLGVDLLHKFRAQDIPPGQLWIDDQDLGGNDPDQSAFAEQRARLLYLEGTE